MVGGMRPWFKRIWQWVTRPARLVGLISLTFGLPGLIENYKGWSSWLREASETIDIASVGTGATRMMFYLRV